MTDICNNIQLNTCVRYIVYKINTVIVTWYRVSSYVFIHESSFQEKDCKLL